MKTSSFFLSILIMLIGISCESNSKDILPSSPNSEKSTENFTSGDDYSKKNLTGTELLKTIKGTVTGECKGTCDCLLTNVDTPDGATSCSCTECAMHITFDKKLNPFLTENEIRTALKDLYQFKDEFNDFTQKKHGTKEINEFNKIEFNFTKDIYTILFDYEFSGKKETVMIAYNGKVKDPKTYVIDCNGSCGCREFYFFNPPHAECSCTTCSMTVTENKVPPGLKY